MKIYLAGKVPKGDKDEKSFVNWREVYSDILKNIFDAEFIDPYGDHVDEADYFSVFGKDCKHIKESDIIIINAEKKLGVGTAHEMLIAKYFSKPVITVLPKETPHRRKNIVFFGKLIEDWIHPFIHSVSDFIVEDVNEILSIKEKVLTVKPKDITVIDEAIKYVE
ncbi:hypothetical protein HON49_00320 [archaeon]|nr:hypothetical protein [archaeon]